MNTDKNSEDNTSQTSWLSLPGQWGSSLYQILPSFNSLKKAGERVYDTSLGTAAHVGGSVYEALPTMDTVMETVKVSVEFLILVQTVKFAYDKYIEEQEYNAAVDSYREEQREYLIDRYRQREVNKRLQLMNFR